MIGLSSTKQMSSPLPDILQQIYQKNPEFRSMDYLAEVEERIKHKIEQIEEEIGNTHERAN